MALTGLTMAMLTLHPEQVDLVSMPGLPRVFLFGPPGTGKTVVLVLKGLQWLRQGKDVHLISTCHMSLAVALLIQHQLRHAKSFASDAKGGNVHLHTYDLQNKGEVETAVSTLASAARDGELYVIADEAVPDDSFYFAEFCTLLAARVPALHLWAASLRHGSAPDCLCVESLTIPLRCPPSVEREVAEAAEIQGGEVLRYSGSPASAPTDGSHVRWIVHSQEAGHSAGQPENCRVCGDAIADMAEELRAGQPAADLQYRDVFILCPRARDDLGIVSSLRARGLPVNVVTDTSDVSCVRDVALAVRDAVTVTSPDVVLGLERRVVIWVGPVEAGRLRAMSRCTAQLVVAGTLADLSEDDVVSSSDESGISDTETSGSCSVIRSKLSSKSVYRSDSVSSNKWETSYARPAAVYGYSDQCISYGSSEHLAGPDETAMPGLSAGPVTMSPSTSEQDETGMPRISAGPVTTSPSTSEQDTAACQQHQPQLQREFDTSRGPRPSFSKRWQFQREFTSNGGQLQGDDSDVILSVPEGALQQGARVIIKGAVCTDLERVHRALGLTDTERLVSPVVEYSPDPEVVFENKPVTISIPHFMSDSFRPDSVAVYRVYADDTGSRQVQKLQLRCDGGDVDDETDTTWGIGLFSFQGSDRIEVLVKYFCAFVCTCCERESRELHLRLYGTYEPRTATDTYVDLDLLVWDGRLKIKDLRMDCVQRGEDDSKFLRSDTLPAPDISTVKLEARLNLLGDGEREWVHYQSEIEGQPALTANQDIDLQTWQPSCVNSEFKRLEWRLKNKTGRTPAMLDGNVRVDYTPLGAHADFLPTPGRKLSVRLPQAGAAVCPTCGRGDPLGSAGSLPHSLGAGYRTQHHAAGHLSLTARGLPPFLSHTDVKQLSHVTSV